VGAYASFGLRPTCQKPIQEGWCAVTKFVSPRVGLSAGLVLVVAVRAATVGVASAQATTSSGHARPLSVTAFGAGVSIGDTGELPSTGGSKTASLTNLNVLGFVTVGVLQGTTSGSGTQSTSQASLLSVSIPIVGFSADVLKSSSKAECNGTTPSVSGSSDLVNVMILGLPISAPTPNVAIVLPGGFSVMLNEQKSSTSGTQGSITVNAIHVTGPRLDNVVSSAQSDIDCSRG